MTTSLPLSLLRALRRALPALALALSVDAAAPAAAQHAGSTPASGERLARRVAAAADRDLDLAVDAYEWARLLAELGLGEAPDASLATLRGLLLLRRIDANRDGELAAGELTALFEPSPRGRGARGVRGARAERRRGAGERERPPARLLVRAADADGDGCVAAAERDAFLAELGDGASARLDPARLVERLRATLPERAGRGRLARALDEDGDGRVARATLEQLFAGLDADGDGRLARDELAPRIGGRARRHPARAELRARTRAGARDAVRGR